MPGDRETAGGDFPASGTFGPYVVLGELGRGTFGIVYRVRHEQTGADYALKALHAAAVEPELRERFLREITTLASLTHPGIVRIHTSGKSADGSPWYVMELVDGKTLGRLLRSREPLPAREAARLL